MFIQWATFAATQLIVAMDPLALAVPTRTSVYEDSHVKELVSEGTIRHFNVVKDAIDKGEINIKPGFPLWDNIEGEMMNMLKRKLTWLCTASVVLFGTASKSGGYSIRYTDVIQLGAC